MKVLISPLALFGGLLLFGIFGGNKVFGATVLGLTRTHSGAGVTVKVTYLNPKETESVRFEVVLDTHSVNLDGYDLKVLSVLRDETGKEYQSTQVENKGSGHHREIILIFPKSSSGAKRLDLVIKDIAKVKERSFSWHLSQ
jgi:hypothetical protein